MVDAFNRKLSNHKSVAAFPKLHTFSIQCYFQFTYSPMLFHSEGQILSEAHEISSSKLVTLSLCYFGISMGVPALKLAYCLDFVRKSPFIRFKLISSLAQLSTYNSDSGSEEESSSYSVFLQKSDTSTNTVGDQFVDLDTFRVTQIMHKLRSEPANAYSFFFRLKESGFKHDVDTYMAIIRILCHWGMDMRLDSILLEVIESEKLHLGFDISDLFHLLVKEAQKSSGPHSLARAFDALLKVYISLDRLEEAIDTLLQTTCNGFFPDIRTFNFLMNRLTECKKIDKSLAIYKELKRVGLKPNVYTYGIVIKAFCIKGDFEEAREVFKEMAEARPRVTPSAWTYTIYIEGLCNNGRSELGYEKLRECRSNMAFDVYAYLVVIRGFVKENKLKQAELILNEIEQVGLFPDQDCYRALIRGYCDIRDINKSATLHNEMLSKGIKTNCLIVSSILQCMCRLGNVLAAVELFNLCKDMGIFLDKVSFTIVIAALCKLEKVEEANVFFDEMKSKKMVPDVPIYTTLINGYFIKRKPCNALILLGEMIKKGLKPDIITYNVLAKHGFSRNGTEQGVFGLLKNMKEQGLKGKVKEAEQSVSPLNDKCPFHLHSYAAMVDKCCESNDTDKAHKLFVMYSKQGVVLRKSCYENIIAAFCNAGDMKKARLVFDFMFSRGLIPDVITCTIMLNGYCRNYYFHESHKLLNDMKKKGIEPDVITYTVLIDGYSKMEQLRRTQNDEVAIETKDDVLTLWEEMQEMEIKPDKVTYTVLICGFISKGDINTALTLFDLMIDEGLEPDKVTCTALICGFCKMGDIDKAVTLFNAMKENGLIPDTVTYRALICGCCKKGDIDRAVALLNEMFSTRIDPDTHTVLAIREGLKQILTCT